MTYGRGVQMAGNKEDGNKKVWNREELSKSGGWSPGNTFIKAFGLKEAPTYLRAFSRCVVRYGMVWFGLLWKKPHEPEDEIIHLTFSKLFCQSLITKRQKAWLPTVKNCYLMFYYATTMMEIWQIFTADHNSYSLKLVNFLTKFGKIHDFVILHLKYYYELH